MVRATAVLVGVVGRNGAQVLVVVGTGLVPFCGMSPWCWWVVRATASPMGHGGDQGGAGGVGHGPGRSRAVIEVVRVVLGMGPEVADQGLAVLNSGPC